MAKQTNVSTVKVDKKRLRLMDRQRKADNEIELMEQKLAQLKRNKKDIEKEVKAYQDKQWQTWLDEISAPLREALEVAGEDCFDLIPPAKVLPDILNAVKPYADSVKREVEKKVAAEPLPLDLHAPVQGSGVIEDEEDTAGETEKI